MPTNCLAECAHLTTTVSEIERHIGRKSSFFHTPLHSTPLLREFPSEHRHPVWNAKTRMAWLPGGKKISKISLFVLAQLTNVMDGRTDGHRVTAYTAVMHRAVKQEAHLSQRDRAVLGVIEYFAKSLKVIRNGIFEKGVNPY